MCVGKFLTNWFYCAFALSEAMENAIVLWRCSVCPSVCPSVAYRSRVKPANRRHHQPSNVAILFFLELNAITNSDGVIG